MKHVPRSRRATWLLATGVALLLNLYGCTSTTAPSGGDARLRITNAGPSPTRNLTVVFPEEKVAFGDVPAGTTTVYREMQHGVFSYAAYQLEIDGAIVSQPVIDWVGEKPMEGRSFTYTIDVDPGRTRGDIVRLVRVTRDD